MGGAAAAALLAAALLPHARYVASAPAVLLGGDGDGGTARRVVRPRLPGSHAETTLGKAQHAVGNVIGNAITDVFGALGATATFDGTTCAEACEQCLLTREEASLMTMLGVPEASGVHADCVCVASCARGFMRGECREIDHGWVHDEPTKPEELWQASCGNPGGGRKACFQECFSRTLTEAIDTCTTSPAPSVCFHTVRQKLLFDPSFHYHGWHCTSLNIKGCEHFEEQPTTDEWQCYKLEEDCLRNRPGLSSGVPPLPRHMPSPSVWEEDAA